MRWGLASPTDPCPWANKRPSPFFVWSPWQNEGPDLPTTFQILEDLLCKERTWAARIRLALQGEDLSYKEKTCSARIRLALQGKEARPHYYKSPNILRTYKVRVTTSSLALSGWKKISDLTFGGYLAGSTPEPLWRCFCAGLYFWQRFFECKDRASHWRAFQYHHI